MADRDVERNYPATLFAAKLRRLADALETGQQFRIEVANQRFEVARNPLLSVEHERAQGMEEATFSLSWRIDDVDAPKEGEAEV